MFCIQKKVEQKKKQEADTNSHKRDLRLLWRYIFRSMICFTNVYIRYSRTMEVFCQERRQMEADTTTQWWWGHSPRTVRLCSGTISSSLITYGTCIKEILNREGIIKPATKYCIEEHFISVFWWISHDLDCDIPFLPH